MPEVDLVILQQCKLQWVFFKLTQHAICLVDLVQIFTVYFAMCLSRIGESDILCNTLHCMEKPALLATIISLISLRKMGEKG